MDPHAETATGTDRREHRREFVADFGERALEFDDVEALLSDAAAGVADVLDAEFVAVLELLPGDDELRLRQGVGWDDGLVGSAHVPNDERSPAGRALHTGDPVVADFDAEERCSPPELLARHGVESATCVVVGPASDPWGVLGAYSGDRADRPEGAATFLRSVANVLAGAIDRQATSRRLRDREAQMEVASEAASVGLWTWDVQADVVTADDYLAETYGVNPDDASGAPMEEFYEPIHEEDADRTWTQLQRAVEETGELDVEYRVRDADGELTWLLARGEVEYDEDGDPVQLDGAITDITEHKRRERELEASERRYRELFTSITDAYCVIERIDGPSGEPTDFRYVEANPAFEENTGIGDVVGKTLRDVVPGRPQEWVDTYDEVVETGESVRFERELRAQERILECYAFPVGDPENERVGVIFTDVTERKERERELERALDLLEKTERIADVGGWEVDPETTDVFWTDHIFTLLDVSNEEEPPLEEALDMYHEADRSAVGDAIETALESGEAFDVEARVVTETDDVRWLRLQGVPETDGDEVISLRGAAQDVTERKRHERRLEQLIDELEESNERLEQFAHAASHDLQEPLRMVSTYLQLIRRRYADDLDEEGHEYLDFAVDGAERMREMVQGLLTYSRIETHGDPLEPVDLDAALEDVLTDLQLQLEDHDAEVTAVDLPRVAGDETQLRQLFQNLLENAIEYSGEDPPHVHVDAERDGAKWVVSVRDDGPGIDPADADRVFQMFEQLQPRDEHQGAGLGLALCKRIVQRHGGEIWLDSEAGDGATFSFSLPAVDGQLSE